MNLVNDILEAAQALRRSKQRPAAKPQNAPRIAWIRTITFAAIDPRELATLAKRLNRDGIRVKESADDPGKTVRLTRRQARFHARAILEQNSTKTGTLTVRRLLGQRLSRHSFDRVYGKLLGEKRREAQFWRGKLAKDLLAPIPDDAVVSSREARRAALVETMEMGNRAVSRRQSA